MEELWELRGFARSGFTNQDGDGVGGDGVEEGAFVGCYWESRGWAVEAGGGGGYEFFCLSCTVEGCHDEYMCWAASGREGELFVLMLAVMVVVLVFLRR